MPNDRVISGLNGWVALALTFVVMAMCLIGFIAGIVILDQANSNSRVAPPSFNMSDGKMVYSTPVPREVGPSPALGAVLMIGSVLLFVTNCVCWKGFFTQLPNEARVVTLFGAYKGTVRESGFFWINPFATRKRVSMRVRNEISEKAKVNDKQGNPIEIAAVVVWRVADAAQAVFDVDDFEKFVHIQTESAVRHLANIYPYDHGEEHEPTLRGNVEEVSSALRAELEDRVRQAGVAVDEARLTHLAYAPEIAQAMLRRQQAEAVIAARQKIVQGAVTMVEMALRELSEKKIIEFDDERKAAMVSNLLVVLCGESEAQPIINAGTIYP